MSTEMRTAMTRDLGKTGFGLGLAALPLPSRVVPGKRGNTTGFDRVIGFVPETHRWFVILTNQDARSVIDLAGRVLPPRG